MHIDARILAPAVPFAAALPALRTTGPRFSLAADSARGAAPQRSAAPLATLDAILMLQEEDPRERRGRQAKRGQDLLAGLDHLKAGLLAGRLSPADLESLSAILAAGAGPTGDAGLDETIAAIELRVKVELAKLGRA
ncbi:flagellar assembly protein FliX [Enterovirga rhinocerotis]|uniref:Class II flagellar assembly regulator n=1 Tax=Enterovirga rhinocerotis TaxID=1339210 RepID=A0A4R7C529_9HYPH|nr:flagellar assembly protein FliX [Enterovirga rhinocerotis]TDR93143.1 class II flagellar assembly regulator [Enterovirga rhinocerotis]